METIDENRLKGAVGKYAFRDFLLVHCPNCRNQAQITFQNHVGVIECKTCFMKQVGRKIKFKPKIDVYCANCRKHIEQSFPLTTKKVDSISITCQNCGAQFDIQPKYTEVEYIYINNDITDPIFGCSLWLQTNFKNEILWAFNRDHLEHIRKYVIAKLRERQISGSQTLAERLPQFIKSAKNRNELLKSIRKMQNK